MSKAAQKRNDTRSNTSPQIRLLFDQAIDLSKDQRIKFLEGLSPEHVGMRRILAAMLEVDASGSTNFLATLVNQVETSSQSRSNLSPGTRLGDLVIVKELGFGSGGTVYLATDLTLGRLCAVKVVPGRRASEEAQILARLSHPNIVQVFRAVDIEDKQMSAICMRYVNGTNLSELIDFLRTRKGWKIEDVRDFLDTKDGQEARGVAAGREDLSFWEQLSPIDFLTHVLRSVAEALSYAHRHQVLHLDVKPSNILLDCMGNVCLVDFNVSLAKGAERQRPAGGTLAFMAPEHYQAVFDQGSDALIDDRCDVYSFGILIEALCECLDQSPEVLRHLGARCAEFDRERRPAQFQDLLTILNNVTAGTIARRRLANFFQMNRVLNWCSQHRFLAVYGAAFIPNALASCVQIIYNRIHIIEQLDPHQRNLFDMTLLPWNLIVFTSAMSFLIFAYQGLTVGVAEETTAEERESLRQKLFTNIHLTGWVVASGWLAGFGVFVSILHGFAGPLADAIIGHFAVSFALAMVLSLVFSLIPTAFINSIMILPHLVDDSEFSDSLFKSQLDRVGRMLRPLRLFAGITPLIGASVAVYQGPGIGQLTTSYPYQLLVTSFIVTSIVGFGYSSWIYDRWREGYAILTRSN